MAEESFLAERAVGIVGGISAVALLLIASAGGPQSGCPTSTPATGLCAMDWSFQTANAARRVAYALVGFAILAMGSFLISWRRTGRRGDAAGEVGHRSPASVRLGVVIVVLALLAITLLSAAVGVGFTTPPTRTLTFANSQLPSVGDFLTAYYGTERAATVYLTAGEALTASYSVTWYENGSTTPVCCGGGGFPPNIEPAGEAYNYSAPWTFWYIVPKTGPYTIWVYAESPVGYGPYTSNMSLSVTVYNVDTPPMIQLALASLGGVLFAAAVAVDWMVRPPWRARS